MSEQPNKSFPYVSYGTFKNSIKQLAVQGKLPPQVDHSCWPSMSGSARRQLFAAMKFFELIEDSKPTVRLEQLALATDPEWKAYIGVLVREFYPDQLVHLENGTPNALRDSMKAESIATADNAVRFLMGAAKDAGDISISPRHTRDSNGPAQPRTRRKRLLQRNDDGQVDEAELSVPTNPFFSALLSKFPTFDPTWDATQQKSWFDNYARLLELTQTIDAKEK